MYRFQEWQTRVPRDKDRVCLEGSKRYSTEVVTDDQGGVIWGWGRSGRSKEGERQEQREGGHSDRWGEQESSIMLPYVLLYSEKSVVQPYLR